jgi:hypothetical protein
MANWIALNSAARYHAANTPGFIPAEYVLEVAQAGNPVMYVLSLGYNIQNIQGEEAVEFHSALYSFCMELCLMDVGWVQYQPFPLLNGAPPPMPGAAHEDIELPPQPVAVPQPEPQVEPQVEPQPGPQADPQPEPQAEPQPEPQNGGIPAEPAPAPQPAPAVPAHLLGPNVGVVAPLVVPPPNPTIEEEDDPNIIELDWLILAVTGMDYLNFSAVP